MTPADELRQAPAYRIWIRHFERDHRVTWSPVSEVFSNPRDARLWAGPMNHEDYRIRPEGA